MHEFFLILIDSIAIDSAVGIAKLEFMPPLKKGGNFLKLYEALVVTCLKQDFQD